MLSDQSSIGSSCWSLIRTHNCHGISITLGPGQTITTFQRNMSQHCSVQHVACVWPPCCDVLRCVGCCWLKFENGHIFDVTFVDVAWCCSRLVRLVQPCCARACALVRFSTRRDTSQHGGQTHATCCDQKCCDILCRKVAIVWPGITNTGPTMLRYVEFNCCDGLARALKAIAQEYIVNIKK